VPTAFATGRVDAMITSPSTGVDSKAWDFLTHFHDTQAWLPRNMVIVNRNALAGLSEEERNAVLEAAKAAEERGWQMSRQETDEAIKVLAENGITIVEPSDELRAELAKIGETMTEEWKAKAGADGEALLDAYRN
jgi:TRAP-type C4-dicarboxylate transport system substrate-binding protein